MTKELLTQITNLATFIFEEPKYNNFMSYLLHGELTSARLVLDETMDHLELELNITDDDVILSQYSKCDELEDLIMDLLINEREYGEGKQIRSTVGGRRARRPQIKL